MRFFPIFITLGLAVGARADQSLFDRLGGIQKIADFVSRAVDKEVADPMLAKNKRFNQVVNKANAVPLKFIVTESLSSLIGGKQRSIGPTLPQVQAWFKFTKKESDRAWALRMEAMKEVGIPDNLQAELRMWLDSEIMKAKAVAPPMKEPFMDSKSLYARLGGVAAISMVVDEFVNQLASDPVVATNEGTVKALTSGRVTAAGLKLLVTEQLVDASGGPWKYTGRSMAESHKGLFINEAQWDAGANILVRVLNQFKVPEMEMNEVIRVVIGTKGDIVGK